MNRNGRAALLLALGAVALRLVITGDISWFVQQHMRLPVLAAGLVLLALGLVDLIGAYRAGRTDPAEVRRSRGPAVGWLLCLPLVVLVAVAPTGLGASAADRVDPIVPADAGQRFEPLISTDGPAETTMYDFVQRALLDDGATLEGVPVRLTGIVVHSEHAPDGFLLTRFLVSCCAADGIPIQVRVRDAPTDLAEDTWVSVTGVWRPPPGGVYDMTTPPVLVELDPVTIDRLDDPPDDPYESPR